MSEHLFGTSLLAHLAFYVLIAYLFLLAWKHALGSHGDLRAIGLASGLLLIPAWLFSCLTRGSDLLGTTACFAESDRWWNFALQSAEGEPACSINLITATLLLSGLYVATTAATALAAHLYNRHLGGHIHALHKVLIKWSVVLLGLIVYLKANDVNLTPLLLGMGAVSIVIGLALQEPLANFFSGIALDMEGTIKREEWIRVSGEADTIGKVVEKGWRTTKLLTIDNELVTLPNRVVANQKILNFHRPETLHVHTLTVSTAIGAPPIKVKEVLRILLRREPTIANEPPPEVRVVHYGDSCIDYQLRFWVTDYGESDRIKDMVLTRIWYAFHYNHIEFSTPVRVMQHQNHLRAAEERSQRNEETGALVAFLRTIPLLDRHLVRQDFEFMALNAFRRAYAAGEHILIKGVAGDALFIIQEGSCEVVLPIGTKTLGPGEYFGEMSLLKSGERSADITAGPEGTTVLRIDRACMETLFRYHPEFMHELVKTRDLRQKETNGDNGGESAAREPLGDRIGRALRRYLRPW